jgi:hypothetical protein
MRLSLILLAAGIGHPLFGNGHFDGQSTSAGYYFREASRLWRMAAGR